MRSADNPVRALTLADGSRLNMDITEARLGYIMGSLLLLGYRARLAGAHKGARADA